MLSIEKFKNLGIFQDLCTNTLESLAEVGFEVTLKKGAVLFLEREKVENIYIVLKGKVTMYRISEKGHKRVVYILNEGEVLNEVIFDNITASINCEAFEKSVIMGISKETLLRIMEQDFYFTQKILNSMSKKIRRLYRQLKNTLPIKMDKRVAAKLWKLSKDYGVAHPEGTMINLNITVTYLAEMLGSSRETISRCLKELEELQLIKTENKRFIVEREKLASYFKGV